MPGGGTRLLIGPTRAKGGGGLRVGLTGMP